MSDTLVTDATRRAELGAFLRQKRTALRPEDVGLGRVGRRHVRGLRREEVAQLAGIGTSWYAMLEQGRIKTLGERTLSGVGEALRLSRDEREYVYRLARSFAAIAPSETPEVPAAIHEFVEQSTGGAVFLMTVRFDVLTWNARGDELFAFSNMRESRNLLESMLLDTAMTARFRHLDETLRNMVALLRANYARYGGAGFESFVTSLRARSERFAEIWDRRDVELVPESVCTIDHPQLGPIDMHLVAFTPVGNPEHMLVTLTEMRPVEDSA